MEPSRQDDRVVREVRSLRNELASTMDTDLPWELEPWRGGDAAPAFASRFGKIVVLDTNILISHLSLLQAFVMLLQQFTEDKTLNHNLTPQQLVDAMPQLYVPRLVVAELDKLKKATHRTTAQVLPPPPPASRSRHAHGLRGATIPPQPAPRSAAQAVTGRSRHAPQANGWRSDNVQSQPAPTERLSDVGKLARAAITWLLDQNKSLNQKARAGGKLAPSFVRGQRSEESYLPLVNGVRYAEVNDDYIFDACLYFDRSGHNQSMLLSNDKNLCLKAQLEQIEVVRVDSSWNAQRLLEIVDPELARALGLASSEPHTARSANRASATATATTTTTIDVDVQHFAMQEEYPEPPSLRAVPIPALAMPETMEQLCQNVSVTLAGVTSLALYKTVLGHRKAGNPRAARGELEESLGDWHDWDGAAALRFAKQHWAEGLEELCKRGLARAMAPEAQVVKGVTSSSGAIALHPVKDARPIPKRPTALSARLRDLLASFTTLAKVFDDPSSVRSWPSIRFEVLFDETEECILAIMGGALPEGSKPITVEVANLAEKWWEEYATLSRRRDGR